MQYYHLDIVKDINHNIKLLIHPNFIMLISILIHIEP